MQATDISVICFELVRLYGDRILMQWEDDRCHLLQEVKRLEGVVAKQARTIQAVQREFKEFKK